MKTIKFKPTSKNAWRRVETYKMLGYKITFTPSRIEVTPPKGTKMNNDITISQARKGLVVASYKTLKILENSKYSNDLRTWNNPDRVGMLDLFLATLNPKLNKVLDKDIK